MEQLTSKQERVLEAIKIFMAKNGYPPTVREIGTMINLRSSATIHAHITLLEEKGYLKKGLGKNRTIELLVPNEYQDKKDGIISIPLIDMNLKGNIKELLSLASEIIKLPVAITSNQKNGFALIVRGNEMMNAGIFNQDILVIEEKSAVSINDIIVVLTSKNHLLVGQYLKSDNQEMLKVNQEELSLEDKTILGKVISLYRKF